MEERKHLWIPVTRGAEELIGDGEAEHAEGELVVGDDGKDVAANGFGLFGLVDITI